MNEQEPDEFEVCPQKQRITVYVNDGGGISIKGHADCGDDDQVVWFYKEDVPALIRAIRNARRACK